MPAIASSIIAPVWDQLAALLPSRDDGHPIGCHRSGKERNRYYGEVGLARA